MASRLGERLRADEAEDIADDIADEIDAWLRERVPIVRHVFLDPTQA